MKLTKRMLALLTALCLLGTGAALAEDDSDYSLTDVVPSMDLDADDDEDDGFFIEDSEEQQALAALENMDMEIDDSINPDDLELNTSLPDNVVNILLVGIDTRDTTMDEGLQHGDVQIILSISNANNASSYCSRKIS